VPIPIPDRADYPVRVANVSYRRLAGLLILAKVVLMTAQRDFRLGNSPVRL
jgi:hypothetical protein